MELDLQSLFGLLFTAVLLAEIPQVATPPLFSHLGSYKKELLVSQDRRHLTCNPLGLLYWLVKLRQGWRAVTTTLCHSQLYPPSQGLRIWPQFQIIRSQTADEEGACRKFRSY
jgi:hypothetical protein